MISKLNLCILRCLFMSCTTLAVSLAPTSKAFADNGVNNLCMGGSVKSSSDPDAGPLYTKAYEYRFPATVDNTVLQGTPTEIWARIYAPACLGNSPLPIVMMLHGNHATCGSGSNPIISQGDDKTKYGNDYTKTGTCPSGQAVIQSHLGYDYLAQELASWGYLVVSINANRGITAGTPISSDDYGLNLARGRLVLRHLAYLSKWNKNGGTLGPLGIDLKGKIDFNRVGLFGHSRGGEGVRAAYNLYKDLGSEWPSDIGTPVKFPGIFELGPVDGQTSRTLNAAGTAWNVLLPMCDGDVKDLSGMRPFDRMLSATGESPAFPKSMYAVWGANHNFYNTQWQENDQTVGCSGFSPLWTSGAYSSANEQRTASTAFLPFFRTYLDPKENANLASVFNPLFPVSPAASQITRIDRSFVISPNATMVRRLETFPLSNSSVGSSGVFHDVQNVKIAHKNIPQHDTSLSGVEVSWNAAGSVAYFQDNWTYKGSGLDISTAATLDFRVSRASSSLNPPGATDFEVRMTFSDGSYGIPVSLSKYASLVGPVGMSGNLHDTLQTVRIPIQDLTNNTKLFARGVRFTFNGTTSGDIYIADISFSRYNQFFGNGTGGRLASASIFDEILPNLDDISQSRGPTSGLDASAKIIRMERKLPLGMSSTHTRTAAGLANEIEIEIKSDIPFEIRNAAPVLLANGAPIGPGFFTARGDIHHMAFRVKFSTLSSLPAQFKLEVGHKEDLMGVRRNIGMFNKSSFPTR